MTALKIADLQRDAYTEGREEGISLGRKQGIYQTKLETARTMISIGLPEGQILLCTGLPLETIHELMEN